MRNLFLTSMALILAGCFQLASPEIDTLEFDLPNDHKLFMQSTIDFEGPFISENFLSWKSVRKNDHKYDKNFIWKIIYDTPQSASQTEKECRERLNNNYPENICDYTNTYDNFLREKIALHEKQPEFHKEDISSPDIDEIYDLRIIDSIPYYTVNKQIIGDCGHTRFYETFIGEGRVIIGIIVGQREECAMLSDREVDHYIDELNIRIE